MTPEQKLAYEMTLSANALAVKNENKKIQEARLEEKRNAVVKALKVGKLSNVEIADYKDVSIDFVLSEKQKLSAEN